MLKSSKNQGNTNSAPKPPVRFLWLVEAVFVVMSVFAVIALVAVLYLSASNTKKSQDAQKFANNLLSSTSNGNSQQSELIAKNEPAVVRIAAAYCPEFDLRLGSVTQNFTGGCSAGYGSGFIISPDGYIATNGHVVKSSVGEVLLTSIEVGNLPIIKNYLSFLERSGIITQATAADYYRRAASGDKDALKVIADTLSNPALDKTETKEISQQGYYAVQLSNEAVEFNIDNLKAFKYSDNIVQAKLVDSDYDPYANVTADGFNTSDVALLKIDGNNFPYNILGSIDSLSQGNQLTVIGFPGGAENELVTKTESIPTPTTGTVSSIRTANGTKNKLIQTDTSIAKGNSGGPAYNNNGEVVGIATYQVSDDFSGGSKFNYMRDIQDLKDLLTKNGITLGRSNSGTQSIWEQGLNDFSNARYTSAINKFNKIKNIYPPHRLVNEFIAKAQSAKSQGKESNSGATYVFIALAAALIIVVPTIILFIIIRSQHRRRDRHEDYKAQTRADAQSIASSPQPNLQQAKTPNPAPQNTTRSVDMLNYAPAPKDSENPK